MESELREKIGQLLCEKGYINQAQLNQALFNQHEYGGKLGQILIDLGQITQAQLEDALTLQQREREVI